MRVCVVGMGKVGLPLAVQFAGAGLTTIGADIDPQIVDSINSGVSPFDFEAELATRLDDVVSSGRLSASTSTSEAVAASDQIVVVVPLLVGSDGTPDFAALDSATTDVGRGLTPSSTVVFETTVPIGTTRNRLLPILAGESGLVPGRDFGVAFSPERVSSGTVFRDLRRYPKLVGGIDKTSAKLAAALYEAALEFDERHDLARPNGVWVLGSAEAAEMAKLAETVYRDVNIALANEFAAHAEVVGVDVWEVIAACNSQPYSHIHRPGVSVGGHCIPVYPHLYMASDREASLPSTSRSINKRQPARLTARLLESGTSLEGKTVVVLGAAYRGGVKETVLSGVFDLVAEIDGLGGEARVHDPMFEPNELESLGLAWHELGGACDLAILHTDHASYKDLVPRDLPGCSVIVDGRGMLDPVVWEGAGVRLLRIGVA